MNSNRDSIAAITQEEVYPGSLNLILKKPILLKNDLALAFERGHRLLWPAQLNGMDVWLYRWAHCPSHIIEIVSAKNLRNQLNLQDNDSVNLTIDESYIEAVSISGWLAWFIFWFGREKWFYSSNKYYQNTAKWCRRLGATQYGKRPILKPILRRTLHLPEQALSIARKISDRLYRTGDKRDEISQAEYVRAPILPTHSTSEKYAQQIRNLLNYTKLRGKSYSATQWPAGYHTIVLNGCRISGQRDPERRMKDIPIDFSGKSVLDIGTNQGGMLFALREQIKWGVGLDYDARMINIANKIRSSENIGKLNFYCFNVDNEPFQVMLDLVPDSSIDVILLLSVCMWIQNWKGLIAFCAQTSPCLIFETNGTEQQQLEQEEELWNHFETVKCVSETSEDDESQKNRKLFICENSRSEERW